MSSAVIKNIGRVAALAVAAALLTPIGVAQAGTSGTDHQLSIDCNADASGGGLATYDVVVSPGDTITITNLGNCDADLASPDYVTTVTPPGAATFTYAVVDPLANGHYEGVVGDLGSNWPIVIGTIAEPTSWISLTVGPAIVKVAPKVTLKGPGKAVKSGEKFVLKGTVQLPVTRQSAPLKRISELKVKLFKKTDSGWQSIQKVMTGEGTFSFGVSAKSTTKYQARTMATTYLKVGTSKTVRVDVTPKPTPPPANVVNVSVSKETVKQGKEIVVSASCGKACAGNKARLQKKVAGEWQGFAHTRMNDKGRHNFKWDTVTLGTYKMRVVVKNYAASKTVTFDVVQ